MRRLSTAAARLAARRISDGARCILEHQNGSALYTYDVGDRRFLLAFWGTASKAHQHYWFTNDDRRNVAIARWKLHVEEHVSRMATADATRRATPCALAVGTIVNTTWGYDQTNVTFYVVTRVSRACVWVRRIRADHESTGFMSGRTWPAMPIDMIGPETRHLCRGTSFYIDGHLASVTTGDHYESSYA